MITFAVYDGTRFIKRFANIKDAKEFVGNNDWRIRIEMCEACND